MKQVYTSIILLITMLFGAMTIAQEGQKKYINYQGVARNADGNLMKDEPLTIGVKLNFGSSGSAFEETHELTTDANGVFSLLIGKGNVLSGEYDNLPWGEFVTSATVSINGNEIGTTEMMAVPHALSSADNQWHTMGDDIENKNGGNVFITGSLYASKDLSLADGAAINEFSTDITLGGNSDEIVPTQKAIKTYVDSQLGGTGGGADNQNAAEVAYDNSASGLTATTAQTAIDELVGSGAVDADSDPSNEIQTLSFDGTTNELSLTDGGSVILPSAAGAVDADVDPTNEIQDISLSGTELTISDGSTIDLAPIVPPGGTDNQNAGEVPYDNTTSGLTATDAQTAIDELVSGGLVDTDDQALVLTGDVLTIEDGLGSIDLSAYKDEDVTTKTGILLGDGTAISGLIGTADGQVIKWNAGISKWEVGTDATGGGGSGTPTGLEAIDEGNGVGWRLIGRDPNDYGNVGENAVDLAFFNELLPNGGATGEYAFATGANTRAIGDWSTSMGRQNSAEGEVSFATGFQNIASGDYSTVMGRETQATGSRSVAMNSETSATGDAATSMGFSTRANGRGSVSMGAETKADAQSTLAIGRFNVGGGHPTNWVGSDPVFEIGNGDGPGVMRANAFTVLKSGWVGIGTPTPTTKLEVMGTIRSSHLAGTGERNVVADANGDLIIGAGGGGSSLWSENGGNIHFNSGNVGIGTTTPAAPFEIKTANGRPFLMESTSDNSYMQYATSAGKIGYSGVWSGDNDVDFGTTTDNSGGKTHLTTRAIPRLTVDSNGNVGAGTTSPATNFEVSGTGTVRHRMTSTNAGTVSLQWMRTGNANTDWMFTAGTGRMEWSYSSSDLSGGKVHTRLYDDGTLDVVKGIRSGDLTGTGERNVVADADGNLIIGAISGGGASKIDDLADGKSDASGSTVFLGLNAGANDNGTNNYSVGIGFDALTASTNANYNAAIGYQALSSNTTGGGNTAAGSETLVKNKTGTGNTATGRGALFSNISGDDNTAVGLSSNFLNDFGDDNTSVGARSLRTLDIGSENTAVGSGSLYNLTNGSNNIGIGFNSEVPNGTGSNQVRIGNTAITYAGVQVAWTVTSDERWKDKVRDLPYGLDMVNELRPVDYIRKNNENETREIGFIAQEVEKALAQLEYQDQGILTKDDKGYMSLRYNDFVPVLTKAIQEQQEMISKLKNEQKSMLSLLIELKTQMGELVEENNKKAIVLQK